MAQLEHIEAIEKRLWSAADTLRDKTEAVFVHAFRAYPTVPSPYYASMAS
jgi:hypothetical protein